MLVTRTPLRLSLCGGGTDLPSVYRKWGGLVVGGAVSLSSYLTVRPLPPFHPFKSRIVYSEIELVTDHRDIKHGAVAACLAHTGTEDGVEVFHQSDIPSRSGTGSSSTFVVGLLNALYAKKGMQKPPEIIAEEAIHIEQVVLRENVGCQDQIFAAMNSSPAEIRFHRDGTFTFCPLVLSPAHLQDLESHLLMFFTGISRDSTQVASSYYGKLEETPDRHFAMVRLAEVCSRAIREGDYERMGAAIEESWRLKAGLSKEVTNSRLSQLLVKARLMGAWGGKVMGAGGGGCIVVVAPPVKREEVIRTLVQDGCVHLPFSFSEMGSHVVYQRRCL